MKNTKSCPKCGSTDIVRIPDNPNRHASGNNIYTSTYTLFGKIPVIRYVFLFAFYMLISQQNITTPVRPAKSINAKTEMFFYAGGTAKSSCG